MLNGLFLHKAQNLSSSLLAIFNRVNCGFLEILTSLGSSLGSLPTYLVNNLVHLFRGSFSSLPSPTLSSRFHKAESLFPFSPFSNPHRWIQSFKKREVGALLPFPSVLSLLSLTLHSPPKPLYLCLWVQEEETICRCCSPGRSSQGCGEQLRRDSGLAGDSGGGRCIPLLCTYSWADGDQAGRRHPAAAATVPS